MLFAQCNSPTAKYKVDLNVIHIVVHKQQRFAGTEPFFSHESSPVKQVRVKVIITLPLRGSASGSLRVGVLGLESQGLGARMRCLQFECEV